MFQSNFKIQVSLMSYQYKTFNSSVFIINTLKVKTKIRPFSYTNSKYNDSTPPPLLFRLAKNEKRKSIVQWLRSSDARGTPRNSGKRGGGGYRK